MLRFVGLLLKWVFILAAGLVVAFCGCVLLFYILGIEPGHALAVAFTAFVIIGGLMVGRSARQKP